MANELLTTLETPSGIVVNTRVKLRTDKEAMRSLIESGVPFKDVAAQFKVKEAFVRKEAKNGGWLTPAVVGKMRRELEKKQSKAYRDTGAAADVATLKAQIWDERGEALNEKIYEIVREAVEGLTPERARRLIQNPLGLAHITTVVRQITGQERREAQEQPRLAVNIGLLGGSGPVAIAPAQESAHPGSRVGDVETE